MGVVVNFKFMQWKKNVATLKLEWFTGFQREGRKQFL